MKKFFLAIATIIAIASQAMAERTSFVIEQTAIETYWNGLVEGKYQVIVAYIMQNKLDKEYQFTHVNCSLFLNGKLIGSAFGIVPNVQPLSGINGSAVGATESKPDTAECSVHTLPAF